MSGSAGSIKMNDYTYGVSSPNGLPSAKPEPTDTIISFAWPLNRAFDGNSPLPTQKTGTVQQLRRGLRAMDQIVSNREDARDVMRNGYRIVSFSTDVRVNLPFEAGNPVELNASEGCKYTGYFKHRVSKASAKETAIRHLTRVIQSAEYDGRQYALLPFRPKHEESAYPMWETRLLLKVPWHKTGCAGSATLYDTEVVIQAYLRPLTLAEQITCSCASNPPPAWWALNADTVSTGALTGSRSSADMSEAVIAGGPSEAAANEPSVTPGQSSSTASTRFSAQQGHCNLTAGTSGPDRSASDPRVAMLPEDDSAANTSPLGILRTPDYSAWRPLVDPDL